MVLPITGYGHAVLRKIAQPINKDYPDLDKLIADMYETMYAADGVGLAAPQVDLPIRIAVIGFRPYDEKTDTYGPVSEEHTLINPEILEYVGEKEYFNEGCLSIPDIHEDVLRTEGVRVRWYDEQWQLHEEELHGMFARVAQHEIDHLDGKVFTDRLSSLRRTMLKRKLNDVATGRVRTTYRMKRALRSLALVVMAATLLAACGPSREERINQIEQFEDSIFENPLLTDEATADELTELYVDFADKYKSDSLAPIYLFKAAESQGAVLHTDHAVELFHRVIDNYPDFADMPMCFFLIGNAYDLNSQYEEAKAAYQLFVDKFPDHYMAEQTRLLIPRVGMSPEEMLADILAHANDTIIAQ